MVAACPFSLRKILSTSTFQHERLWLREKIRFTSESWSQDALTLEAEGISGADYELAVLNPEEIRNVDGAELRKGNLTIRFPASASAEYIAQKVVIHFQPQ